MTNKEKIARIKAMHKEATEMVAWCQKQMVSGDTSWTLPYSMEVFKKNAAALKYALKGLRLMQDLVNDEPYMDAEDKVQRSTPYMVGLLLLHDLEELDNIILDLNNGRITLSDFVAKVWNKAYTLGRKEGYECNANPPINKGGEQ